VEISFVSFCLFFCVSILLKYNGMIHFLFAISHKSENQKSHVCLRFICAGLFFRVLFLLPVGHV
jgi:hypothetical protein